MYTQPAHVYKIFTKDGSTIERGRQGTVKIYSSRKLNGPILKQEVAEVINHLRSLLNTMEADGVILSTKLKNSKDGLMVIQRDIKDLTKENSSLEARIFSLEREIFDLRNGADDTDVHDILTSYEKFHEELEEDVSARHAELQRAEGEVKDLKSELSLIEENRRELEVHGLFPCQ